jgi:signal transduction histidine kinase
VELTSSLDIEEILIKTLGLASQAVGVRRGSIMLRDTQTRELVCRAVLSADGSVQPAHIPISFARGPGLSGWVMEQQQAIRIGDVRKDKRWLREEGRATDVRSVVAVPLLTQNEPLGVLILTNSKVDYFGEAQLQLLKTIANEVAIVIHNAELYTFINDLATRLGEALGEQREESSKRQAILQSVNEGVIVLDERESVVLFNPAAEQVLGIPADFALLQPLAHLRDYGETTEQLRRAEQIYTGLQEGLLAEREQGKAHTRMLELPAPAQTIALNFAPVVSSDGVPYGSVAVLRDVTREIEADRAKRDFISSVSHELRTPLTSIKGYVDLLLLGAAGPISEGQLSFLGVVKNNANRLMDLINDILEIGRIDAHKITLTFDQINVGHVLSDVLQTLRAEVDRKSIVVSTDVQEGLPEITADPRRVTQVVLNLLSNAVKYTYAEGRVGLRAFLNPSGMVQVDVEDNGVGISPEQQQHLFRRFYRADNPLRDEAGGTGLGLSIAKSFVELHGGEMWVKSEASKGSIFSFILPVTQPEQIDVDEDSDE